MAAYLIWRLDCECGLIEDYPDGVEPPETCPDCGREVERNG